VAVGPAARTPLTALPKSTVYGPLAKGVGYVQFCLYDEITG
jgi:hypothetical protein